LGKLAAPTPADDHKAHPRSGERIINPSGKLVTVVDRLGVPKNRCLAKPGTEMLVHPVGDVGRVIPSIRDEDDIDPGRLGFCEQRSDFLRQPVTVGSPSPQAIRQPPITEQARAADPAENAASPASNVGGGYSLDDYRRIYVSALRRMHASASENVLVAASSIVKRFSRSDFKLGPLSFELVRGEITGVVGMNASGKTTLLNLILGRLRPEEGHITYPAIGANASWAKIKSQLASVDQLPERWYGSLLSQGASKIPSGWAYLQNRPIYFYFLCVGLLVILSEFLISVEYRGRLRPA
jgi:ABC transporter